MKFYRHIEGKSYSKIEVSYSLGGMNYFSGRINRRGVYIHFTKVERGETDGRFTSESFMLFGEGNFKILAKELKRKSAKEAKRVADFVAHYEGLLHDLYMADDRAALLGFIQKKMGCV